MPAPMQGSEREKSLQRLEGKVAVIAGGAGGIVTAPSRRLATEIPASGGTAWISGQTYAVDGGFTMR